MTDRHITADARQAGKRIIHTLYGFDGEVIGTRTSERRYYYAICKRYSGAHVEAVRWSASQHVRGGEFAVLIKDAA